MPYSCPQAGKTLVAGNKDRTMTTYSIAKPTFAAVATLAMLFGAPASALADHGDSRAQYDYATVISSRPIIRYVTVTTPERECWEEMRYYTVDRRAHHTGGAALIGALIGGVVGHQIGSGHGRDAATVAGTLIGAAIGTSSAYKRYGDDYAVERHARPVRRCKTHYREHREERIDGYKVTYRYNGQKYVTNMPYDPGRRIRVRIDVRPAE